MGEQRRVRVLDGIERSHERFAREAAGVVAERAVGIA
jgi:hypothetical protein